MDAAQNSKKNPWLIAVIPLALIGLGILISQFFKEKDAPITKESVFSLWVAEAEIAPAENNQARWDKDGSAPDPGALVTWQDQVVLETVVAKDSLIAPLGSCGNLCWGCGSQQGRHQHLISQAYRAHQEFP